jgi:hypothetical protein
MGLINYIQNKVITSARKKSMRKAEIKNLSKIRTAGIIFERDSDTNALRVQRLANRLQSEQIEISVLAFVNMKKPTEELLNKKGLTLFFRKDLNWIKKPKAKSVTEFINKDFDLLIKADFSTAYPLGYICGASKARLICGPNDQFRQFYDLIIEGGEGLQASFHDNLIHYLSIINKPQKTKST